MVKLRINYYYLFIIENDLFVIFTLKLLHIIKINK